MIETNIIIIKSRANGHLKVKYERK